MATLDQLPAEQRAIVELVVQRGRSYDALADVLQVPVERVRELARDALVELSPRTASRVELDWRGQVADYLLGQQSNDAGRTTRDYLKRSETARAWALSLLDSLDPLYAEGTQPVVPEPGAEPLAASRAAEVVTEPEPEDKPEREAEPPAATRETAEDRVRARERARKRRAEAEEAEEEAEEEAPAPKRQPARKPGALSPAAQAALKRRRLIGGGVAALLVVVLVLIIAGVFSGGDDNGGGGGSSTTTATTTPTGTSTTAGQPIQVLGQIALTALGKTNAQGVAYVVQQGKQRFLVVQAKVPPLPNTQKVAAYEVWLYNSNSDARSLGAQYTNAQGVLQGRAPLPADFAKFKAVDVSRELFSDKNTAHGPNSVLRGTFASLKPVPQQQQGGATSTTPTP
jgi:hypothetical protein